MTLVPAPAQRTVAPDFVNREAEDDPDQPERNLKGRLGWRPRGQAIAR